MDQYKSAIIVTTVLALSCTLATLGTNQPTAPTSTPAKDGPKKETPSKDTPPAVAPKSDSKPTEPKESKPGPENSRDPSPVGKIVHYKLPANVDGLRTGIWVVKGDVVMIRAWPQPTDGVRYVEIDGTPVPSGKSEVEWRAGNNAIVNGKEKSGLSGYEGATPSAGSNSMKVETGRLVVATSKNEDAPPIGDEKWFAWDHKKGMDLKGGEKQEFTALEDGWVWLALNDEPAWVEQKHRGVRLNPKVYYHPSKDEIGIRFNPEVWEKGGKPRGRADNSGEVHVFVGVRKASEKR